MAHTTVLSAKKAMNIITILVFEDEKKQGFRLSELSRRTGIRPNTLHNLIQTMVDEDYAARLPDGRYTAGRKIQQIGIATLFSMKKIPNGLYPVLEKLQAAVQENVLFYMLANGNRIAVAQVIHEGPVLVNQAALINESIYEKATGRILISYCDEDELQQVINQWGMPGRRWDGIETPEQLEIARTVVRRQGACALTNAGDALRGFAYPVLRADSSILGALGVYAPSYRCDEEKEALIDLHARQTARTLEQSVSGADSFSEP